jgi:ATP-dependent helicase/nuclease subunit A
VAAGGRGDDAEELLLWSPRKDLDEAIAGEARSEHRARQMEEYRRLLYVALTRAEDRLYVGGWQTGQMKKGVPAESWYSLMAAGLRERATTTAFDASVLIGDEGWQGEALRLESAQAGRGQDQGAGRCRKSAAAGAAALVHRGAARGDAGRAAADAVAAGGRRAAGAHAPGRR